MTSEEKKLLWRFVDGTLPANKRDEVRDLLDEHPEYGRILFTLAEEKVALEEVLETSHVRRHAVRREMVRNRVRQARPVQWGRWITVAACLAIIVGAHLINLRRTEQFVEVLVAHIQQTEPNVKVIRGADGRVVVAIVGMELFPGDRIEAKKGEKVVFGYPNEKTKITVGDGKRETSLVIGTVEKGKRLRLEKGMIDASVAPQPADRHMVIETPHAEAKVVGTGFALRIDGNATWLNVKEGSVELTRLDDGKVALVEAGLLAVAGASAKDFALKTYPAGTKYVDGPVVFSDDFEAGMDKWQTLVMSKGAEGARILVDGAASPVVVVRMPVGRTQSLVAAVSEAKDVERTSVVIPKRVPSELDAYSVEFDVMRDGPGVNYLFALTVVTAQVNLFTAKDQITHGEWHHIRLEVVKTGSKGGRFPNEIKCFSDGRLLVHDRTATTSIAVGCLVEDGTMYFDNYVLRDLVSVEKGAP